MLNIEKQIIQQAKQGESLGVERVGLYDNEKSPKEKGFKSELDKHGIKDIAKQTIIKREGNDYIFFVDDKPLFVVEKSLLKKFIQNFYQDLKKSDTQNVQQVTSIELKDIQGEQTLEYFKGELDTLKNDIEQNLLSEDIKTTKRKIDRLLAFFEQEKDLSNERSSWLFEQEYKRSDKGLRKMQKKEITNRINQLKDIKKHIEWLEKNKDKKYTTKRDDGNGEIEVKMDDINGYDANLTLRQFSAKVEELGKEAPEFILQRNRIIEGTATTPSRYGISINTPEDAQILQKILKQENGEYEILNKINLETAKQKELNENLKRFDSYLTAIIKDPNNFRPPFVPTHVTEFNQLCEMDPTLKQYYSGTNKPKKSQEEYIDDAYTTSQDQQYASNNTKNGTEKANTTAEYTTNPYTSINEAFERGGIGGMVKYGLDQTNMKPEQKQFWGGVGNLAVMGGIFFVGWKMLSSAFKLLTKEGRNEKNLGTNLARLGIPTALIMGSQMYSGEGPLHLLTGGALTQKIAGIFGGKNIINKNETTQDTETRLKYAEGFPGATAVFNGLNYGEMSEFLIQDGDKIKIDPDKYDTLVNIFKNGSKKNEAAAAFLESIGKNDDKCVMDLALTGMGIKSVEDLKNSPTATFNETASEAIIKLRSVTEYMETKGYNKINPETQPLVDRYIARGKNINELEDLDARGDVFYKETTLVDRTGLENQITTLVGTNIQKKQDLLLAINTFYNQMPNASKKIELGGTRPTITFKTYEQSSTINLENKELVGFTPSRFDSYAETFKAANLTNRIKFLCKTKEAKSDKPFYLSTVGRDITFDNASLFSTSFDTEIMTAGWGGSLKKVSPILDTYKQEYCDYLNAITPKFWKEKATI